MSVFQQRATGTLQDIDAAEVTRAASILFDPASYVMIQGLPCARTRYVKGNDINAIKAAVESFADQSGIYWSLNPCPANLANCVKNDQIISRRWLLIDVDPHGARPADANASDAEHESAQEKAAEIMDWLSQFRWPIPISVDSGNGWHLLYRVDLPNSELAHAMIRDVLHVIADKFDVKDEQGKSIIEIDRAVHDARRISKMPGTWARKGPMSDDRPHRLARIVYVPETIEILTASQLMEIGKGRPTKENPKPPPLKPRDIWKQCATDNDKRHYAEEALRREVASVRISTPGNRNKSLFKSAAACGNFIGAGLLMENTVESDLGFAARMAGLPDKEIAQCLKSGLTKGKTTPRDVPERNGQYTGKKNGPAEKQTRLEAMIESGESILIRANTIEPRKIEWLWPGRIPIGKLTTFAGVGGLGKTFVLCDITARISRGLDWPDAAGEACDPGQVLFVTGEDDNDDTLVPRLITLGADLEKVLFLRTDIQDQFTLADLPVLDRALEEAGPGLRFVAIDPPTAFLGDVDDHKNAELRGLLSPLKSWAAKHRIAIVFNTHVNKPQSSKVDAMMRVMGSVAWVNAVRAAHMFARDPEDHERRLFCCMKMNVAREKKGLAYRLAFEGDPPKIEWLGEVETTADEAINQSSGNKRRDIAAAEWLEELFANAAELPSKDIYSQKKKTTISDNALREAKDLMGIRATQKVDGDGRNAWHWFWPQFDRQQWQQSKTAASTGDGNAEEF